MWKSNNVFFYINTKIEKIIFLNECKNWLIFNIHSLRKWKLRIEGQILSTKVIYENPTPDFTTFIQHRTAVQQGKKISTLSSESLSSFIK